MSGDMWVESEEGEGSTFYFRVKLSTQPNSPTYGEQFKLNDLGKYNTRPLVISGKKVTQQSWTNTLRHFGMTDVKALTYPEAIEFFKKLFKQQEYKNQLPTTLIIDADFDPHDNDSLQNNNDNKNTIIEKNTLQNISKTETMTSNFILQSLQQMFDISTIPKLCINDVRLRNTISTTASTSTYPFRHSPITPDANLNVITPLEERANPFDIQILSKPFKNTKLIHCLHLLSQSSSSSSFVNINQQNHYQSELLDKTAPEQSLLHPSWNSAIQNNNGFQLSLSKGVKKTINLASTSLTATPLGTPLIARQQQHNYNFSEVLGSVRALLVDDNPINRKVLAKMLSRIGLTCDIAHNGKEALDKWIESKNQGQPIELILMDICMPVMNGLEVATRIREESTATFPYIIALTACVMNGDKEKCFESGTFF